MRELRAEWYKLKGYRPVWVLLGLYALSLLGLVFLGVRVEQAIIAKAGNAAGMLQLHHPFGFPKVWQTTAYLASYLQFLPTLVVILLVSNEFQFRTHRQNLLDGASRGGFFLTKVLLTLILSLCCTLFTALVGGAAGLYLGGSFALKELAPLGAFLIQTCLYTAFGLGLSFAIRRSALVMAGFLLYSTVLENVASLLVDRGWAGAGKFLPLQTVHGLLPFPFLKQVTEQIMPSAPVSQLLTAAVLWWVLLVGLAWWRFAREDL
jgi:hypothetical protein